MKNIKALFYIVKVDLLYNARFRLLLSSLLYVVSVFLRIFNSRKADKLFLKAHHYSDSASLQAFLNPRIKKLIQSPARVNALLPAVDVRKELLHNKYMFVAKPYKGPREKGVIFLMYSIGFNAFFKQYDVQALLQDYFLVLEPEWAGYCKPEILVYASISSSPVIVQATEPLDYSFIQQLDSNLVPVDFGASDWLDPGQFFPIDGAEKKYDCIMVCDWYNYKRHYALFRALANVKEHNLKVLLVSNATGILETLKNVAYFYDVLDNLVFMQSVSQERLNILYNESKVNILLSYKEGSNKTLFEGMFANTPAILTKDNIGVKKSYINDATGRVIDERQLPETLVMFSREYAKFQPRHWVLENISCHRTTQKLSSVLESISSRNGDEWTEELRVKVNIDGLMKNLRPEDAVTDCHLSSFMIK